MIRLLPALLLAMLLGACSPRVLPAGPALGPAALARDALVMPDGARLPLHAWLPEGPPHAVLLALHGFNDAAQIHGGCGAGVHQPRHRRLCL
ncbi:hypothetical protein ACFQU2_30850 [Siccirubricoccus deserti]